MAALWIHMRFHAAQHYRLSDYYKNMYTKTHRIFIKTKYPIFKKTLFAHKQQRYFLLSTKTECFGLGFIIKWYFKNLPNLFHNKFHFIIFFKILINNFYPTLTCFNSMFFLYFCFLLFIWTIQQLIFNKQ